MAVRVYIAYSDEFNKYYTGIIAMPESDISSEEDTPPPCKSKTGAWEGMWTTEVSSIEDARKIKESIRSRGARMFLVNPSTEQASQPAIEPKAAPKTTVAPKTPRAFARARAIQRRVAYRSPSDLYHFTKPPRVDHSSDTSQLKNAQSAG